LELATGAFVLPNAVIHDDTPLESFIVPGKRTTGFHQQQMPS
jgi:hypothetical protein